VKILQQTRGDAKRIEARRFEVKNASSLELAEGRGKAHAYILYFEPGGEIGPHEAGYGQLLLAVSGDGWVAGGDGIRYALAAGEVAFIARGERHSKGSETGLTALMVQVRDLDLLPVSAAWPRKRRVPE
jgi:quercetin dioxygenase-like cupin family protein